MQDISELRNELQRKEMLIQKHLTKIHHWQQVLEDINVQHKKPTELPQGPLAFLEQASANLPAPMKPNWAVPVIVCGVIGECFDATLTY